MKAGTICGAALVVVSCAIGCGGSQPVATNASAGAAASAGASTADGAGGASGAAAGASSATGPASSPPGASPAASAAAAGAAATAPKERPFANTPLEAQSLIQEQIDGHIKALWKCVADWRAKKNDAHKALVVDIGIDQEGNLLGITSPNPKKADVEPATRDCMMATLHGLPFPRSHAGVITVRQTFSDVSVQP
ncbi:MAG TPA: hypothetical protein VIF09_17430 [Polyangiaceae bacterium]